jgi:hypothetical protein
VGQEVRRYVLEISPLSDWRGLEIGRLLLLLDVTERRRAQAQILEQQRALAMLRERESLARELHDSMGQVLGFASLKMGATRALIAGDQLAKADDQLARLEDIMADAHADVREYILNLRTAPTEERPFFSALQHYLAGFRQNYGFQVDLSIGPGVDDGLLPPEAQMQLFRIVRRKTTAIILDGHAIPTILPSKRYLDAARLAMFARVRERFLDDSKDLQLRIRRKRFVTQSRADCQMGLDVIVVFETLQVSPQYPEEGLLQGRRAVQVQNILAHIGMCVADHAAQMIELRRSSIPLAIPS